MENQRITIWHTTQQRKIVGNAAPMAKNLQDYLDKHGDCEVYTGQDRPGAQKQENPMDMVLSEKGEADFYTAHRSKKQTIPMWVPGRDQEDDSAMFPQPPAFMMHHSPNTLATQPPALWTRLSPSDADANGMGEALREADPRDPPKEIQADQTGVPQMSPPDRDASMLGTSLDSDMGDVEFEVTLMSGSGSDDDDGEVYVLDEEDGLTMELTEGEGGEVELEVWVTEEVTVEEYEQFVAGGGSPAIEFEDEEVEGAIREFEVQQTPRHVSSRSPVDGASGGGDDDPSLTPFEPMSKQPVLETRPKYTA